MLKSEAELASAYIVRPLCMGVAEDSAEATLSTGLHRDFRSCFINLRRSMRTGLGHGTEIRELDRAGGTLATCLFRPSSRAHSA